MCMLNSTALHILKEEIIPYAHDESIESLKKDGEYFKVNTFIIRSTAST